jgi:adenine-specific DNA-methyltransferase
MVDPGKERYGMNWPGKADCFKIIQQPSIAALTPARDESIDFDTTENLFIEGDNLEVLKLLQKSYFGKVKMIYVDPPYNTGNDFIYPDDYSESLDTYLRYTGQIDNEGRKYSTNTETDGRFHSKWMNMMYPRLFLARNLLREDGVIFISIDDREVDNLKKVCNEVFGEQNLIAQVVWEKMYTTKNDSKMISDCHEYLLVYSKAIEAKPLCLLPRSEEADERYSNPDNDHRGPWKAIPLYAKGERTRGRYPIKSSKTGKIFELPPNKHWLYIEEDTLEMIQDNRIWFGQDGNSMPNVKRFLSEVQQGMKPKTLWKFSEVGSNDSAKREIKLLFGENPPFDFPKPVTLMRQMLYLSNSKNEDNVKYLSLF